MSTLPEISREAAMHFGLLLHAAARGNAALAVEQLVSIPAADLDAIEVRLARYGVDLSALMNRELPR